MDGGGGGRRPGVHELVGGLGSACFRVGPWGSLGGGVNRR
jgi:hypothetical protein